MFLSEPKEFPLLKYLSFSATLAMSVAAMLVCVEPAQAQDRPIAYTHARLIPISSAEIEEGTIVFHKGKIVAIGPNEKVEIPDGAFVQDVQGRYIMPGLVDTHNHIGGIGGGDGSSPTQPDVRIYDSLNCLDSGFRRARAGGLTTLNIMPGSGHLLSGQTVYVKLRRSKTIEEMMVRDAEGKPMGGMKMANGTNSIRDNPPWPGTRGKSAALVRKMFIDAQEYGEKIKRAAGDESKQPPRDIAKDALLEVLSGKRLVHHHTHRHDDIMTVLRLKEEFGFRCVLHHTSEAWKVPAEIAKAGVGCSIIVLDSPGGKLEAKNKKLETGGILEKAGVKVAIHTDDWITDSRFFLRCAALAHRAGMSRAGALKALTINGAEMLDMGDRIGTLEVGKDADFVMMENDPLSVYCKVTETWIEGNLVWNRLNEEDRLYAVGGFGAGDDTTPYLCCAPEGGDDE